MLRGDRGRTARRAGLLLAGLLMVLGLSGCVRVHAALSLGEDDTVSGEIVIAGVAVKQGDTGPALEIPDELSGKVRTQVYTADGYVGQTVSFQQLTFSEVGLLADSITEGKQYRLSFRRAGDLVTLAGSVDLTQVPPDRADVQFKIAVPGTISRTNGVEENGTITWKPKAGAVTEFTATVQYTDNAGVSWTNWVLIVGGGAIGVAAIVAALALFTHRRSLKRV